MSIESFSLSGLPTMYIAHRRNNGEKVQGTMFVCIAHACCQPTPPPFSVLSVCSQFAHFLTKNKIGLTL